MMFSKRHRLIIPLTLLLSTIGIIFFELNTSRINVKHYSSSGIKPPEIIEGEATIKITSDGFIPDSIVIRRGTAVRFVNEDSLWHWPASDLHPSHSLYPEFDAREAIAPGRSWSFIFNKNGEWGMHDHLSPYILGKIIVRD